MSTHALHFPGHNVRVALELQSRLGHKASSATPLHNFVPAEGVIVGDCVGPWVGRNDGDVDGITVTDEVGMLVRENAEVEDDVEEAASVFCDGVGLLLLCSDDDDEVGDKDPPKSDGTVTGVRVGLLVCMPIGGDDGCAEGILVDR